jgi:hypothetical protein
MNINTDLSDSLPLTRQEIARRKQESIVRAALEAEGYTMLAKYEGVNKPLAKRCANKHVSDGTWGNFRQGTRCQYCKPDFAETVKAEFARRGFTMLSEYVNSTTHIKFICPGPEKHRGSTAWASFTQHGCRECAGQVVTYEQVKKRFEERGYEILATEYINSKTLIPYRCPSRKHCHSVSWNSFNRGSGCPECSKVLVTHETVLSAFEAANYILLSEYKRKNTQKLRFICPQNHCKDITWAGFKSGKRCRQCAGRDLSQDDVAAMFAARGFILVSQYIKNAIPLKFVCQNNHLHKITLSKLKGGDGCGQCSKNKKLTWEEVNAIFAKRKWTLVSKTYKTNTDPLEAICPEGHPRTINLAALTQSKARGSKGNGCAQCDGQVVTIDRVRKEMADRNYTLLSKTYKNNQQRLKVICPVGCVTTIQWGHFNGGGNCGICFPGGYNKAHPGTIYYVRFDLPTGESIWKIGITNQTIAKRFAADKIPYTVLFEQRFDDGSIPPELENRMLKKYKAFKYKGKALLSGNTECFTKDVLRKDKP